MSAKQSHPPVLPVGDMFYHPEPDNWWFSGKAGECRVADAKVEDRVIIAALQRCGWADAHSLEKKELGKVLALAFPGEKFEDYHAMLSRCTRTAGEWERWGKDAG